MGIKVHRIKSALPVVHVKHTRRKRDNYRGSSRERGYTTAWDRFSKAWRVANPLCGYCLNMTGMVTPATQVDHIIPHRHDPELFWPEGDPVNHFMACCDECHSVHKQRAERRADITGRDLRAILNDKGMLRDAWPDPFTPPIGMVIDSKWAVMVIGAPASGKSHWASDYQHKHGGVIYCVDTIATRMGLPERGRSMAQTTQAARRRNELLTKHNSRDGLIFIYTGATQTKTQQWVMALKARVTTMHTPMDVCISRIEADPDRQQHEIEAVRNWFGGKIAPH